MSQQKFLDLCKKPCDGYPSSAGHIISTARLGKNAIGRVYQRGDDGRVIAFISNGAWIDGNSHDGFRASLQKEFDKIYVYNLRGNQRSSGELSRREGGKIFGSGSRTPIAITILVRYPEGKRSDSCQIHYHDIGDYLSREDKLRIIRQAGSYKNLDWATITPNEENDWINQHDGLFDTLLPPAPEKKFYAKALSVFTTYPYDVKLQMRYVYISLSQGEGCRECAVYDRILQSAGWKRCFCGR